MHVPGPFLCAAPALRFASPDARPCPVAGVGRGGGVSWHARRAVRFGGQRRVPRHHPRLRFADPGDPVGRHRLYADLCRVDAGVRPARRHARPSARVLARQRLQRRCVPGLRRGAVTALAAGGARGAGRRCGAGIVMRPGARHRRCIRNRSAAGSLACTRWFSASAGRRGQLLAGVLVQRFGWQSVFWFRAPLSLAAFVFAWGLPAALPTGPRERFDALGAALLVLATGALLLGLESLAAGRQRGAVPGVVRRGGDRLRRAGTPRRVSDHRSALLPRRWISPC